MRLRFTGKLLLVVAAAVVVSSCHFLSGAQSYRYRITVQVDTPEGVRTGSSVWEIKSSEGGGPDRKLITTVRGAAVPVHLPGGTLFALVRSQDLHAPGEYAAGLVEGHFLRHPSPQLSITRDWAENIRLIAKAKPTFDLDPGEYPLLVRFRDINDPATVEQVTPSQMADDFGPGVVLKGISIAITDDRATEEIAAALPWIGRVRAGLVPCPAHTPRSEFPLTCIINVRDFRRNT